MLRENKLALVSRYYEYKDTDITFLSYTVMRKLLYDLNEVHQDRSLTEKGEDFRSCLS